MPVLSGRHWPNKQEGSLVFCSSNYVLLFILLMFNVFFTPYRSTLCYADNGNLCISDVRNLFICANLAAVLQRWRVVKCCAGTLNIKKCRDCVVPFSLWQRHSMESSGWMYDCEIALPQPSSSAQKCFEHFPLFVLLFHIFLVLVPIVFLPNYQGFVFIFNVSLY